MPSPSIDNDIKVLKHRVIVIVHGRGDRNFKVTYSDIGAPFDDNEASLVPCMRLRRNKEIRKTRTLNLM